MPVVCYTMYVARHRRRLPLLGGDIGKTFEGFDTEDERVKKLVHMLKFYAPEQEWDEQNMELWNMGLQEENPWVLQK